MVTCSVAVPEQSGLPIRAVSRAVWDRLRRRSMVRRAEGRRNGYSGPARPMDAQTYELSRVCRFWNWVIKKRETLRSFFSGRTTFGGTANNNIRRYFIRYFTFDRLVHGHGRVRLNPVVAMEIERHGIQSVYSTARAEENRTDGAPRAGFRLWTVLSSGGRHGKNGSTTHRRRHVWRRRRDFVKSGTGTATQVQNGIAVHGARAISPSPDTVDYHPMNHNRYQCET